MPDGTKKQAVAVSRICAPRALTLLGLLAPNPRQGRTPCTCFGRLRRPRMGCEQVCAKTMYETRFFSGASYFLTLSFYPMRLRSLDCGRLFSAKIAFRDQPCTTPQNGRLCGTFSAAPARTFPPPLRELFCPRRSSLRRDARISKKLPSPPFEAARPLRGCGYFLEALRSGASVRLSPYSPLRVL